MPKSGMFLFFSTKKWKKKNEKMKNQKMKKKKHEKMKKMRVFVTLCVRAIVRLRSRERAYLSVQAGMRHACDGKAERTTLPNDLDATA